MNNKNLVLALFGVVILLAGVIIGLLMRGPSYQAPPQHISQAPNPGRTSDLSGKVVSKLERSSEWIINTDGLKGLSFYLENFIDGRMILEACAAFSYLDKDGRPAMPQSEFCQTKLMGRVIGMKDDTLIVLSEPDNEEVSVKLIIGNKLLTVLIDGKKYEFKPGRKNDLLQQFESHPHTVKAKARLYEAR